MSGLDSLHVMASEGVVSSETGLASLPVAGRAEPKPTHVAMPGHGSCRSRCNRCMTPHTCSCRPCRSLQRQAQAPMPRRTPPSLSSAAPPAHLCSAASLICEVSQALRALSDGCPRDAAPHVPPVHTASADPAAHGAWCRLPPCVLAANMGSEALWVLIECQLVSEALNCGLVAARNCGLVASPWPSTQPMAVQAGGDGCSSTARLQAAHASSKGGASLSFIFTAAKSARGLGYTHQGILHGCSSCCSMP